MKHSEGLSAVELLVALVVASVFLISGYQVYTYIFRDGTQTTQEAQASNIAYSLMRKKASSLPSGAPCSVKPAAAETNIPENSLVIISVETRVECPYKDVGTTPEVTPLKNISRIITEVKYKDAQGDQTVQHAVFKS